MGAIRPHTTDVDTESGWDGPQMIADAPNDREVLRYMHAWVDEEGDPDAKQSYKFPHHEPRIGAPAVIAAVNNALARLPQSAIPEADREGVERHLRKHREDAGLESASMHRPGVPRLVERRAYAIEQRAVVNAEQRTIDGYAAVFDRVSEDLGGFYEVIRPGAFAGALARADDVRALVNHDPTLILGRTRAGTLALHEDEVGLRVRVTLPATQYAQDLLVSMERGDISQMSFGFEVEHDNWYQQDDILIREVLEIARLYDVSVVTFPAYPDTVAQARDVLTHRKTLSPTIQVGVDGGNASRGQAALDVRRRKLRLLRRLR